METLIDWASLDKRRSDLRDDFASASPFAHIVFDGLVSDAAGSHMASAFPPIEWAGWVSRDNEHQRHKFSLRDCREMPAVLAQFVHELQDGPFLRWLSEVTGIPDLLPDPHLIGAGLHLTGPGGTLTPHTDFHKSDNLPLYRRINLLFYLNGDWREGDGGALELWDKSTDRPAKTVPPQSGTCVIFQTDNDSLHGFTDPVRDQRRSVALYFYTVEAPEKFSGDGTTYWRSSSAREGNPLRLVLQRALYVTGRGLSWASHQLLRLANKSLR